jgi:hypothetical protein
MFYTGHCSLECTIVLSGIGYKTLTTDALCAQKAHQTAGGATSNVNMMSDTTLPPDLTTAIFPDDLGILDEGESSETSDHSILSIRTPFKCDRLLWNCMFNGPKGPVCPSNHIN